MSQTGTGRLCASPGWEAAAVKRSELSLARGLSPCSPHTVTEAVEEFSVGRALCFSAGRYRSR